MSPGLKRLSLDVLLNRLCNLFSMRREVCEDSQGRQPRPPRFTRYTLVRLGFGPVWNSRR